MRRHMDALFSICFVALLLIPLLFINLKADQVSDIDNTYLPEIDWNESVAIRERITQIENYFNMRIGLRAQCLNLYQQFNDKLFHRLEHPTYMYGKEKWIYFKNSKYTKDYQHLNLNKKWAKSFAGWMQRFSDIAKAYGADYYYMLIPDKKTVYPEYFPDGYNIRGDISRTDQVLEMLRDTDVDWFYAYDTLVEAKKRMLVANRMYDAGHWNENGAFVALQAMVEHLREKHPEIPPLEAAEFDIGTVNMTSLQVSHFHIDEDVPSYTLKNDAARNDAEWFDGLAAFKGRTGRYCSRYVNAAAAELPKLFVVMDSYLMEKEKFLRNHFSEITFVHRQNLKGPRTFEAFIKALRPDIVIFENPERVFPLNFKEDK